MRPAQILLATLATCSFVASAAAQNDLCSSPIVLAGPGIYPFDTTSATTGQGTTGGCGSPPVKNLWYSYTATRNGTVSISTCGQVTSPNDDTEIWVYQGAGCPVGPSLACNDDFCGLETTVSFTSVCGTIYTIEVGNYDSYTTANMFGTFTLSETGSQCSSPSTAFCTGNAVGTSCIACGNNGAAGRGCANSSFAAGSLLTSSGNASISADTLVLSAAGMSGPGLFFQADSLLGTMDAFGDGMLCVTGAIRRMGIVFPSAGTASYPGGLTPSPIHIAGTPISAGESKHYQCWYRDALVFCTGSTFNTSNGVSLQWAP